MLREIILKCKTSMPWLLSRLSLHLQDLLSRITFLIRVKNTPPHLFPNSSRIAPTNLSTSNNFLLPNSNSNNSMQHHTTNPAHPAPTSNPINSNSATPHRTSTQMLNLTRDSNCLLRTSTQAITDRCRSCCLRKTVRGNRWRARPISRRDPCINCSRRDSSISSRSIREVNMSRAVWGLRARQDQCINNSRKDSNIRGLCKKAMMVQAGFRQERVHRVYHLNMVVVTLHLERVNQDLSLEGLRVQEDHTTHERKKPNERITYFKYLITQPPQSLS